ncbi:O-antigen polymerase [Vibrio kanaloae]|nr:O-antigen polymerase [Vibrio kanaloae]
MDFLKFRLSLNCSFFLALWWSFYFLIKIPYFIINEVYNEDILIITLCLVLTFFISFYIGIGFIKPLPLGNVKYLERYSMNNTDTMPYLFILTTIVIFVIYNLYKYGTLNVFDSVMSLGERREKTQWGGVGIYVDYFMSAILKASCVISLTASIFKRKYLLSIFLTVLFCLLFFQSGSKYALVWFLYPIAIYSFLRNKVNIVFLSIPIVLLVIALPIINVFRNRGEFFIPVDELALLLDVLLSRADLFNGLYDLVEYLTDKGDFALGLSIYAVFTRFIPRDILPDRLGSTDTILTSEVYNTSSWVFNYGGIGEFYYNFNFLGVVFIGVLSGVLVNSVNYALTKYAKLNLILFSFFIASPFWSISWGIGFNNLFFTFFMFWLISIPIVSSIYKLCTKIKFL